MRQSSNPLRYRIYNRIRFGGAKRLLRARTLLAAEFIRGSGVEIGALNHPLEVPELAKVTYIDRSSRSKLLERYSEIDKKLIVPVDIVDDGETLASVPDATHDFVIANHLLEHLQNPIMAIENWLRVLKKDGIIFLALPDKRYTFDRLRPLTELPHVVRDWRDGPEWSRMLHYEEWARFVDRVPEEQIITQAETLAQSKVSIHFHVWTADTFRELLEFCSHNLKLEFEVRLFMRNGIENLSILRLLGRRSK